MRNSMESFQKIIFLSIFPDFSIFQNEKILSNFFFNCVETSFLWELIIWVVVHQTFFFVKSVLRQSLTNYPIKYSVFRQNLTNYPIKYSVFRQNLTNETLDEQYQEI